MNRITILITLTVIIGAALPVTAQLHRPLDQDYFTANDSPQIKELLESVDFYHTNSAEDWIFRGNMYWALGELKYTLDTFPNHPRALLLIGNVAKIKKTPAIAIDFYERALRLYPQYALTHAQYGGFLVDVGLTEEGVVRLKKAIKIDPKLEIAYKFLSKAYTKMGNQELAQQAAEKARELGLKTGQ